MMDLVSVIVPVYNVENYLRECIESIINQTYKKLEIILVDDGSTDGSGRICDEYMEKINSSGDEMKIIVIHKKNTGVSDSRNAGLDKASGEWFFFVDSDDYISLNVIEIFIKEAENNKADFICGRLEVVSRGGAARLIKKYKPEKIEDGKEAVRAFATSDSKIYITTSSNAKLFKRTVYGDIRFPINMISEDAVYIAEALPRTQIMVFIDKAVYSYRDFRGEGKLSYLPDYFKHISDGIKSSGLCTEKIAGHGEEFVHLAEVYRAKSYMELAWMFSAHNFSKEIKQIIKEYIRKAFGKMIRAVFYKEFKFVTKIKLISAIISPVFYRKLIGIYAKINKL